MKIKILDIRLQDKEPLRGFADVELDNGLVIRNFKIIQQPNERAYIIAPQAMWKGQQGKTNYRPIISMPHDVKQWVESAILAEYQKAREENDGNGKQE